MTAVCTAFQRIFMAVFTKVPLLLTGDFVGLHVIIKMTDVIGMTEIAGTIGMIRGPAFPAQIIMPLVSSPRAVAAMPLAATTPVEIAMPSDAITPAETAMLLAAASERQRLLALANRN
jgi:hypothetical protein